MAIDFYVGLTASELNVLHLEIIVSDFFFGPYIFCEMGTHKEIEDGPDFLIILLQKTTTLYRGLIS